MDLLKLTATPLHGRLNMTWDAEPQVLRITENAHQAQPEKHVLLLRSPVNPLPPGFAAYFYSGAELPANGVLPLPPELDYLQEGDVVRLNPRRGQVWVMYRRSSVTNSLLLTERCNSYCVMCSQPPKAREDDTLVRAWSEAIPLMDPSTKEIGITGGEPTLLGDLFLELVQRCREHLPTTALHILSNGRMFNYLSLAQALARVAPQDLMIGIPLYSDLAWHHDYIVQAPRAFDQTIRGILNLARCNIAVEIRVVLHRDSLERLPHLADFLCRNLPFVQHVALMGLEPIGFARANLDSLWVDPVDYQEALTAAVRSLVTHGLNVSIYNHQLCVLAEELWPYARQSISDWKNIYLPSCEGCISQEACGGFFHSATKCHSRAIRPITSTNSLSVNTVSN